MEERPLECSQCKKNASVVYQEVVGCDVTVYHMCNSCPVLKQKLKGKQGASPAEEKQKEKSLCCCSCQTTIDAILMGQQLGCSKCYEVFQDLLAEHLTETQRIAPNIRSSQKNKGKVFHVGRSPEIAQNALTSSRLSVLNQALGEALEGENYEQAAWLRDQINSLMEKQNDLS